ncbi:MAG: prepilin peptidase [Sphingomonadales bacterium]|nr:prepilin peptidase [Sphingomonadales bacterium]MDE2168297.1 prepilin peptidase [Sphingomonadales bacterium]
MQVPVMSYGLLGGLAIALAFAAATDMRRRQIDNWLNAGIALGAPLFWWAQGLSLAQIGWQLAVTLAAFVVLAALFAIRAMGGGDVKLLTALALWIKPLWFVHLLTVMALAGGLLTLGMGAWHVTRRQKGKLSIPYGIAIALAGLWVLAADYLPALQSGSRLG